MIPSRRAAPKRPASTGDIRTRSPADQEAPSRTPSRRSWADQILDQIERLPRPPWVTGKVRGMLGAILLPVILWLVQFGLEEFLK